MSFIGKICVLQIDIVMEELIMLPICFMFVILITFNLGYFEEILTVETFFFKCSQMFKPNKLSPEICRASFSDENEFL